MACATVAQCVPRATLAILLLVALAPAVLASRESDDSYGSFIDIHLRLGAEAAKAAVEANAWVTANGAPHNGINLTTVSRPHVTLYLTEFETANLPHMVAAAKEVAQRWTQACFVAMNPDNVKVVGSYAMWQMANPACLQTLSDAMVNATFEYIVPNQPIPGWVKALPEPLRGLKEAMIKRYGSPNVFSQFVPHVTLAWDDSPSDNLEAVLASMPALILPGVLWQTVEVGITYAGSHGTVPRNESEILAAFPLTN